MRNWRSIFLPAIAAAILASATGCESRQHTRGSLPGAERVEMITPGIHGREDVRAVLGAPSVVSTFDENIWYYIGRRTSQWAFFDRNVIEQQVLIVQFSAGGTVLRITRLDKKDGREIALVERETPSAGRKMSLLEQLFGNIGRFANEGNTPGGGSPRR